MKLAPRSLFGRHVLLIVALIALAQIGSALLVRQLIVRPRLDQLADGLARNIGAVRAGLDALPLEQRSAFVEAFNRRGLDGARDAPEDRPARIALTPLERRFVRTISERVATQGTEVVWRREDGGSLALRLTLDAVPYWIVLPGVLPAREFSGTWIAASVTSALLALLGAYAIQRRLDRPLATVVRAAGELARGATPPPLPEDGPLETAMLARSFNALAASLAQAERERALMLAGVSHDLRTPLAKLRLGVEILADRSEPELTASMNRSVEEMDAIIGQFLDFARSDEAEPIAPGDLDALAREAAAASADHGRTIELALRAPPPVPMRGRAIRRCVGNLIENAFRHGRAPVRVSTGGDAAFAWIEVDDAGDGIAPDQVDTLKQPFQRAHDARSGAPGAGLGLAIVERIVRAHGGRLELLPRAPHGLRARISLPLASPPAGG
ncbi:MAG TPA: ATP-binding protein [Burkholderiaceae bacterium]|nr:ATP-binding protein [Burkholderiaceae bacterium]